MVASYGMDAYRSHELSIEMRTSSGDIINMGFSNAQSLSVNAEKSGNSSSLSYTFSSMQAFSFSLDTNGLDAQDQKEIAAFMEIARPYIEGFMKELEQGDRHTPLNQVAKSVSDAFKPAEPEGERMKNHAKNSIVSLFDTALEQSRSVAEIFDGMQELLERTLTLFDRDETSLYV